MPSDKLSELGVRKAKPSSKPKKLSDGGGLFLLLHPSGSKYWRMKYRFMGKEKLLAIGVWPEVSLIEAREKRNEAKQLLKSGKDPSTAKKNLKLSLWSIGTMFFQSGGCLFKTLIWATAHIPR